MSSHPDADAFVRGYLRNPEDTTARLVFADWLEETGTPSNVAWARFIRAEIESAARPAIAGKHLWAADGPGVGAEIRARLTIPVALFLGYPRSLLQLLPGPNITVRLAGYDIPGAVLERMPESVARENLVLPLLAGQWTLIIAAADPESVDTVQKLQFILNRDIVAVRAEVADIQAAINLVYGQTELDPVDSIHYEFADTGYSTAGSLTLPPSEPPVYQLVTVIIREAIRTGVRRVRLLPAPDRFTLLFQVRGTWMVREEAPRRLLSPIRDRLARLAGPGADLAHHPGGGEFRFDYYGTRYTVRVAVDTRAEDPVIDLDLADEIELVS